MGLHMDQTKVKQMGPKMNLYQGPSKVMRWPWFQAPGRDKYVWACPAATTPLTQINTLKMDEWIERLYVMTSLTQNYTHINYLPMFHCPVFPKTLHD